MVKSFCIDACLMGTDRHLLVDGQYSWIDDVPENVWHMSGKTKSYSNRCLDTVMKLSHHVPDLNPPKRFVTAMSSLMKTTPPWSKVMPARDHRSFVKNLINEATVAIETINKDYYMNTWVTETAVLQALQPARINFKRFESLSKSGGNSSIIESFRPDSNGYAKVVEYDRFSTKTGRLTVMSGANILNLKRDFRDVIIPSHPNGAIAYIDFAALEARVLLYEAGGRCKDTDMYAFISKELFGGTAPRNAIKLAVISELYGSGKYALGEVLNIQGNELDEFVGKIHQFFNTKELLKRVKNEFIKTGKITNRYGRQSLVSEPIDRIFINSYAQSTGVDVSLLGFSSLLQKLQLLEGVRPIFVLHDAMLLDVPPEHIDEIKSITDVKVPGYVNQFPLKCEILACVHNGTQN